MNKAELVTKLAERTEMTKVAAGEAIDALMDIVAETLAAGDTVKLTGFGEFSVSDRAARTGRNPQTGATIEIAASKQPKFSAGAKLKAAVN